MAESLLKFKGSWRSYQKRILDNLQLHLSDEKLHIVAAPGAGKTTLGIEVISRINRCSLILCPTNTIKNQWRDRICSAFLDAPHFDMVSTDIRNPAYITVTTYQALLAAFCDNSSVYDSEIDSEDENSYSNKEFEQDDDSMVGSKRFSQAKADEIIDILKSAGISLLCFDEAHHLRKEWWKALTYLVEQINPKQTVSLTATPPYDVDYKEWQRYEELCGPIDEIISIPELVKNGDLCPHQDFIYFSLLKDSEKELIKKFNASVRELVERLTSDDELSDYFSKMSFLNPKDKDIEFIFENPDFYVSIVSFLKLKGYKIPKRFLDLFGANESEIPKFDINSAKNLLNGLLITDSDKFGAIQNKIVEYRNLSQSLGLVQNKKIVLNDSLKVQKQIAHSVGKLDSICEIAQIEIENLGNDLRMVILADLIKADDFDNSHVGVIPIWRMLKQKYGEDVSIGVLCGSLIVLPVFVEKDLIALMAEYALDSSSVVLMQYNSDSDFIKVTPKDSVKNKIVSVVTELFNRGVINILIGTQALLGEGWDAPVINSLILSSTVSSYMLSNQMRGRAIRVDKNNPNKISNIWHLASVAIPNGDLVKNVIGSDIETDAGYYDIKQLSKRFEGYEAPSYFENHEIVSGISRLLGKGYEGKIRSNKEQFFIDFNKISVENAKNRRQTRLWWENSLYKGHSKDAVSMSIGVESEKTTPKTLVYSGYKQAFISLLLLYGFANFMAYTYGIISMYFYLVLFGIFAVFAFNIFLKYLRTGSCASVMKQIAIIHLETLYHMGYIKTALKKVGISVSDMDYLYLSCKNLTTEENNLLIKSIQEFLDPVENPRYLLVRENRFLNTVKQVDYYAIPALIAQNKPNVEVFESLWHKYIGDCKIFYTRNIQGRKLLLKARKTAFSASKREKSRKLSKWQ